MKKISLIIILLIMPISYATASLEKDDAHVVEIEKIAKKYANDSTSLACKRALQECADKGNYYCSMALGGIYLEAKNYTKAISNFKHCSEECDGECDFRLGLMYHQGQGVLQNDDKAIFYYDKAANLGYSPAAYNISIIYAEKKPSENCVYIYSEEGKKQYSKYATLEYAWLKIAMALGMENYRSQTDEKFSLAELLDVRKENLASRGLLQKGDNIAAQICSKNEVCKE